MKAIKFVVLLLIGVVCASTVGAIRHLQEGSKETELGISIPNTVTTNGVGTQLTVVVYSSATGYGNNSASARKGTKGPKGSSNATGIGTTSGYVIADGPNARAYSRSNAYGRGQADAAAAPNGARGSGVGSGGGTTVAYGSTGPPP
ncbi:hypothetical protein CARUB_v10022438mg [Capsella rubella]|uniref:Uncharacterized protein n=1 Tax=Capsella rubella TaxID=81985 RepID=R0GCE5_9BRAS|nr:UPF0540 protein At1g62220 [Capsella rubella]EOA33271.1 hypothetical protein CARUB_v10022438mg [Capsella rubella]